jgi:hypothetical protein
MAELTEEERQEIELFEAEGEMDDGLFARSVFVGAAVGVPVVGALVWILFTVSDINISDSGIVALAIWSALWAGLLIGGVIGLGVKLIRMENQAHAGDTQEPSPSGSP